VTRSNGSLTPNIQAFLGLQRSDADRSQGPLRDMLESITDLAEKDLALALAFARKLGVALPGAGLTQQLMARVYGLPDPRKR